MTLRIEPLIPELWPQFERLFGPQGACYGCWCTAFRLEPKVRQSLTGDEKKAVMRKRIETGPPPGLLGFDEDVPVSWVQVGPRRDVPRWNTDRTVSRPLDGGDESDPAVWAISCFFTTAKRRGHGYSHAMVAAAISYAREQGARLLEACPMDEAKRSKSIGLFVGSTRVFEAAGFQKVAERKTGRPLMRLLLSDAVSK
jgi:predicted GNAT family acetyltransferase